MSAINTTALPANEPSFAMPYRWVRLAKHCEITGDTSGAVHARRRKRLWTDGVHCKVGVDGNLYINPEAWNSWIENQPSHARAG